ncbi:MAG: flagellar motor switch protein FliN, partial [Citromicrobium sp.]|nr:flagellar motor switch protein FliN [Citromicrobium sp.]
APQVPARPATQGDGHAPMEERRAPPPIVEQI